MSAIRPVAAVIAALALASPTSTAVASPQPARAHAGVAPRRDVDQVHELVRELAQKRVAIKRARAYALTDYERWPWKQIDWCEARGQWHIASGNGYFGGLQFDQQTWAGADGLRFAPRADLATPHQQVLTGKRLVQIRGDYGAWTCAYAAGL